MTAGKPEAPSRPITTIASVTAQARIARRIHHLKE